MTKIARNFVLIYFKKGKRKKISKSVMPLAINKPDLIEMEMYIITYDI